MPAADLAAHVLDTTRHMLRASQMQGDGALAQCTLDDMIAVPGDDANSIATIVRHLHGNMRSRFVDFLTSDGEKPWRERDAEFDSPPPRSTDDVMALWHEGWATVWAALDPLGGDDLLRMVHIRGQEHTVFEALQRQSQHYAYHVGQIVLIARWRLGARWQTLSVPRGASRAYRPSGLGGEPPRKD